MSFKAVHFSEVANEDAGEPGVKIRWLIKREEGAPNFAMRYFELEPEAKSPHHSHSWEHEVFILDGQCNVFCDGQEKTVREGYVVYIPPKSVHHFANIGESRLRFLCLVPHKK
ncbi:MAG TPA: cupin domain-containing protein [Candidatus Bathyarchaeia archaeon]|nr:cupin domain-containing protein [Candidatus Bathyarchaeia archaeon]